MWLMENVCFQIKMLNMDDFKIANIFICKHYLKFKFIKKTSYSYLIAYHILVPKGEDGSVEVSVKLKGYNQEVLAKNDVQDPVRMWDFLYAVTFPCLFGFHEITSY